MLKKGFTLIELLIVIVIIGILSVAVIPRVLDYPKKARDSVRKGALATLNTNMGLYLSGSPATNFGATVTKGACLETDNTANTLGTELKTIGDLPLDPTKGGLTKIGTSACPSYAYAIKTDASGKITDYMFIATLELKTGNFNTAPTTSTDTTAAAPITTSDGQYQIVRTLGVSY